MKSIYFLKTLFACMLLQASFCTFLFSQNQMIDHGNGNYEFISDAEEEDLSFYLFGDGYHSFEHNPTHQYSMFLETPRLKKKKPYTLDDFDDIEFDGLINGSPTAIPPVIAMADFIEVQRSWNLTPEKENYFILMIENTTYTAPVSGCVEFHYSDNEIEINEPEIKDAYGNDWFSGGGNTSSVAPNYTHKYEWDFINLELGEQRFIYIPAKCLLTFFEKVNVLGSILFDCSRNDQVDFELTSLVRSYPHDPNCILAKPEALSLNNKEESVRHRIYFQNEGTGPAQNVKIDLTIEAPINGINLVAASDECSMEHWASSKAIFGFPNINLPGTQQTTDPPEDYNETIGWVDFDVCYALDEFKQWNINCADLTADIGFDSQPLVRAEKQICREVFTFDKKFCPEYKGKNQSYDPGPIGARNTKGAKGFTVSPNPASDLLNISDLTPGTDTEIMIVDSNNRILQQSKEIDSTQKMIDISSLPSGIYFILVKNDTSVETQKFVKI